MKQTITETMFKDAFVRCGRKDQFSYDGLSALFAYLEEMEMDGYEMELDPIALCCDFTEHSCAIDFWSDYGGGYTEKDMDEEEAMEKLHEETCVIQFDGGLIVAAF